MEVDNRPMVHILPTLLLQNVFIAALIAFRPPSSVRFIAFIAYSYAVGLILMCTTGNLQRNYSTGCTFMGQFFTAFHLIWLTDPLKDIRHERDTVTPAELPFWRRMYWALCLIHSPRGVGWSYQVANVPARPSEHRWVFVRQQLLSAFRWYLLIDLAQSYQRSNPLFSQKSADLFSMASQGYVQRCIHIIARYSPSFGLIAMQYCLFAALSVALGWSVPGDWPAVYGEWSDAYTVRRFWGRTYHQLLRRYTASIGKALCGLLGLESGSWASSYTQLYAGFGVSGIMHCGGDFMVNSALFGASFPFFISQAVAISLEDAIIGAAKRLGVNKRCPEGLARCLGYVWVFVWLSVSAPWFINWSVRAGVIDTNRMPLSLIGLLAPSVGNVATFMSIVPMTLKRSV